MFPCGRQIAELTTRASKFYQVGLIFLTLVRDTSFYSQVSNHLPPPPLLSTHHWHLPKLTDTLHSKLPPALAGREGGSK